MPTAIKEHYKPLLHPLSRLTQPIKVEGYNDGKEFVPMLELFKSLDDSDIVDYNGQLEEYDMKIYDELNHCISFDDDDDRIEFCCTGHSFWLFIDSDGVQNILDQYSLFQLLYKWHFDVFGLIPSGLAKELEI